MSETPSAAPPGRLAGIAVRGALLTSGAQGVRIAMQVAGIVILARLLPPSAYGLVAMVAVVVSFGEAFRDFGLSAAAVQAPMLTREQRDNLFWANTGIGLALTLLAMGLSGLVVRFYEEPAVGPITCALALVFVINGLAAQYRASLTRGLRFKALAIIDVSGQFLGTASGVVMALAGSGYWALVGLQLTQVLTTLVLLVLAARWFPGRPRRGQDMRRFWTFGWNLVGSQVIQFLTVNIDSMVIGRRFGAEALGIYDRAYRLLMVPLAQIRTPTTTVALPILSRLADDQDRFSRFLLVGQLALGYTVVAALAFAAGAAEPLIEVLLGPGWDQSVPIFSLLAVAAAMQTLSFIGYWAYLSRGLTRRLLHYSFISAGVRITAILVGSQWGVLGVACAVAIGPAVLWPLSLWWLSRVTPIPVRGLVMGGLRILVVSAGVFALVRVVVDRMRDDLPLLALAAGAGAAVAFTALAWLVAPQVRADLRAVLATLRHVRPARDQPPVGP